MPVKGEMKKSSIASWSKADGRKLRNDQTALKHENFDWPKADSRKPTATA
jgi:hypothetical protein